MLFDIIGKTKASSGSGPRGTQPVSVPVPAERPPLLINRIADVQPVVHAAPARATSRNVLSSDVEIRGTLSFAESLTFDGRLEGEIYTEGSLTVGENAIIKGEIHAGVAVIYGKVEGNVTVQHRCELMSSAELVGDISGLALVIEEGATFVGQSTVGRFELVEEPPVPASKSAPVMSVVRESAPAEVEDDEVEPHGFLLDPIESEEELAQPMAA